MLNASAAVTDEPAAPWDFDPRGRIVDGQHDAFDLAGALSINGRQFTPGPAPGDRPIAVGPGAWRFVGSAGGLRVVRQVRIDPALNLACYRDRISHPGDEPLRLRIDVATRLGAGGAVVYTEAGRLGDDPVPAEARTLLARQPAGQARPSVAFFAPEPGRWSHPRIATDGARDFRLHLEIDLAPGASITLIHGVMQAKAGTLPTEPKDIEALRNRALAALQTPHDAAPDTPPGVAAVHPKAHPSKRSAAATIGSAWSDSSNPGSANITRWTRRVAEATSSPN